MLQCICLENTNCQFAKMHIVQL